MARFMHMGREEANEIADSKISIHDQKRFEIKLDIDLQPGKRSSYRVTSYFFIPRSLNISPHTYDKNRFYASIQQYIRFKTPRMSLAMIIDETVTASPYTRIKSALPQLLSGTSDQAEVDLTYNEIKLLGAISRGAIRDFVKFLLDEWRHPVGWEPGGENLLRFAAKGEAFVADIRAYRSAVDALMERYSNPVVPPKLREALRFFDEFISITIEDFLTSLLQGLREVQGRPALPALEDAIIGAAQFESAHRRATGYPSIIDKGSANVELPYRRSVLKKFIHGSLHLSMRVAEVGGWVQFGFGVAAGLAMLFAAVVTILAQNRYATTSWPFLSIIVIAYIFKDRLKDWLKVFFIKSMVNWIEDRKVTIRDPFSGQVIGYLKEAFSFVEYSRVPREVLSRRNMDNFTSIDEEGKPERVMKHDKLVVLLPERIWRFHERRKDINDITRMNISDLLGQADDPAVGYLYLNPESRELEHLSCARVYHLNIVIQYSSSDSGDRATVRMDRIRLIVNRNGIKSLDEV